MAELTLKVIQCSESFICSIPIPDNVELKLVADVGHLSLVPSWLQPRMRKYNFGLYICQPGIEPNKIVAFNFYRVIVCRHFLTGGI